MDRLERLINLVAALLAAERPLTRHELKERVPGYPADEASYRRAFERDKDALRGMGIPISIEKVDRENADSPEGYRIRREQYELPDPELEPDELAALHLAVSAVRMEGADATAAIWKLGGATLEVEEAADVALAGSEHLSMLFQCVSERRPVRFTYRGDQRLLEPWRLGFRNGRWSVSGLDRDRGQERQFRLDRMVNPAPAGPPGSYERPPEGGGAPPPPWAMGDEEPLTARVAIDADQAVWTESYVGTEQVVARHDDGSIEVELVVTNRANLRSFVLRLLEHAEVLSPPELRDDVIEWLTEIAS